MLPLVFVFVFLHNDDTSISPSAAQAAHRLTIHTRVFFSNNLGSSISMARLYRGCSQAIYLLLLLMLCCPAQRGRINGRVCDHLCCEPQCGRHKSCTDGNRAAWSSPSSGSVRRRQLEPNSSFHFSSSSHLLFCKLGLITVIAFLKSSYLKGRNWRYKVRNGVNCSVYQTFPSFTRQ